MKNVLLIGSELGKGGAERSISLLSYYLQADYNVTLCILSGTDREKYYKTCDDVIFIDPPAAKGLVGKIAAWRYRLRRLKEIKKEKQIDVSISFLEGPDYVNVLTRGKEKVVLSIRGSKIHDKVIAGAKGTLRKRILIPWLYKKADEIVCVTDALAQELTRHFNISQDKLTTIYNFYETKTIDEMAFVPLSDNEAKIFSLPVMISSGRLHVAKEFDKLITVFAEARKQKSFRLMILGDGEMKAELMELAIQKNLTVCDWINDGYCDADVYLMGFQNNAFKYYHHSTLFALSSSWEGFPNVLAEALICNLPVVTTDCHTGPREILNIPVNTSTSITAPVRIGTGTLLPLLQTPSPEIIDMWKNEIIYWLNAERPAKEKFIQLTCRFTLDNMLQQWREVIEN